MRTSLFRRPTIRLIAARRSAMPGWIMPPEESARGARLVWQGFETQFVGTSPRIIGLHSLTVAIR